MGRGDGPRQWGRDADMNEIWTTVTGFVATDPEYRLTTKGLPVIKFRMGSTPSWRGAGGWVSGETSFISVRAFRSLADNAASSVSKGQPIIVQGRLTVTQYVNREGRNVHDTQLVAESIGHNMRFGTSAYVPARKNASLPSWMEAPPAAALAATVVGDNAALDDDLLDDEDEGFVVPVGAAAGGASDAA